MSEWRMKSGSSYCVHHSFQQFALPANTNCAATCSRSDAVDLAGSRGNGMSGGPEVTDCPSP
eukprot:7946726-Pyramimonas_sp.AAC.1